MILSSPPSFSVEQKQWHGERRAMVNINSGGLERRVRTARKGKESVDTAVSQILKGRLGLRGQERNRSPHQRQERRLQGTVPTVAALSQRGKGDFGLRGQARKKLLP